MATGLSMVLSMAAPLSMVASPPCFAAALSLAPLSMATAYLTMDVEPSASSSWYRNSSGGGVSRTDLFTTTTDERLSNTGSSSSSSRGRISGAARGGLCLAGLLLVGVAVVAYKKFQQRRPYSVVVGASSEPNVAAISDTGSLRTFVL
jgi:hypothetical protein